MANLKFPTDYTDEITIPNDNDKFIITDSTVGEALKRISWHNFPFANAGFIQTELEISGTDLLVMKPKMALEETIGTRYIIDNTSNTTIDLTGLVASTWYALCCREDTGAITAQDISSVFSTGGGGNWDTSGLATNQLDMYDSLYDFDRKYCRAYDGTYYYRVFGVFKTNSTPNGIQLNNNTQENLYYIANIPYSMLYITRETNQTTSGNTKIQYNNIYFDINSEWDTINYRYTPKTRQYVSFCFALNNAGGGIGTRILWIYNNATQQIFRNRNDDPGGGSQILTSIDVAFQATPNIYHECYCSINNQTITGDVQNLLLIDGRE